VEAPTPPKEASLGNTSRERSDILAEDAAHHLHQQ